MNQIFPHVLIIFAAEGGSLLNLVTEVVQLKHVHVIFAWEASRAW